MERTQTSVLLYFDNSVPQKRGIPTHMFLFSLQDHLSGGWRHIHININ